MDGRHEDEPGLEHVREEEEEGALARDHEEKRAGKTVQVERDSDAPLHPFPAKGHHEEERQVDLVERFVEELVVADPTEVDEVAKEEVGEIAADGQEPARQRPAQDGQ